VRELAGFRAGERGARYVCVLALAVPDAAAPGGLRIIEGRGTTRGRVVEEPRGTAGFGYDPLFEPARERPGGRTFAEYTAEEKDAISHRGRAARRMLPVLQRLIEGRPPAS
jgi:XTP/dITP diphosphohydrolase